MEKKAEGPSPLKQWPENFLGNKRPSSRNLQRSEMAAKLISRLGTPLDHKWNRPLSAPGYIEGTLKEKRTGP